MGDCGSEELLTCNVEIFSFQDLGTASEITIDYVPQSDNEMSVDENAGNLNFFLEHSPQPSREAVSLLLQCRVAVSSLILKKFRNFPNGLKIAEAARRETNEKYWRRQAHA